MTLELGSRALEIIEKVKKLLALANDKRGNEHQAAAAAAKAQELLEAYNLDMALVGSENGKNGDGKRSDTKRKGGLYKWQRYLWQSVASLNFCMYWSVKGNYKGAKYEHRILGREENVIGAEILAGYLQQTIERIAQEQAKERELNVFCKPMIAYREGMAERLCERLSTKRREKLAEEQAQQQRDQAQQSKHNGDTKHAMVLTSLIADEESLNQDFRWGYEPGTTAQRRRDATEAYDQKMVEQRQWAQDNPEEHAANEATRKAENERRWAEDAKREQRNAKRRKGTYRERAYTAEDQRRNMREFDEGYDAAEDISLDQQIKSGDATTFRELG